MKLAIVPAQITTVEDKVAGSLSLTQLILLATPVFICGVLYGVLPVGFELNMYKMILMGLVVLGFGSMALRIRGILVFEWIRLLARYNKRPRYYTYNKNDTYLRLLPQHEEKLVATREELPQKLKTIPFRSITTHEQAQFEHLILNTSTKLAFKRAKHKKGNLHVTISEI